MIVFEVAERLEKHRKEKCDPGNDNTHFVAFPVICVIHRTLRTEDASEKRAENVTFNEFKSKSSSKKTKEEKIKNKTMLDKPIDNKYNALSGTHQQRRHENVHNDSEHYNLPTARKHIFLVMLSGQCCLYDYRIIKTGNYFCLSFFFSASSSNASLKFNTTDAIRL